MYVLVVLALAMNAGARTEPVPTPDSAVVTVSISATMPQSDGVIGTNEWICPVVQNFYQTQKGVLKPRGGFFFVASDGTSVYVTVESGDKNTRNAGVNITAKDGTVLYLRRVNWIETDKIV
jgi:hypothetical protein